MKPPEEVRDSALEYAYKVFDHERWEQVPSGKRGNVYVDLVSHESFGGILRPYMSEGEIRVWLKDTVAKEYPRALEGIGSTAKFSLRRYPGPAAIVQAVFGTGWTIADQPIHQKPMGCKVLPPQGESIDLFWGTLRGLKDLHWAASKVRAPRASPVTIAITRPNMTPFPADEWSNAQALCELIGADICSVMYTPQKVGIREDRRP